MVKAIIMAGGKGTRIVNEFMDIPKPMISINGKPILEHQLLQLKKYGYENVIIVVGYLGNQIIDYFKDGSLWGMQIEYFIEKEPLGTAGSLPLLRDKLSDDFFVINGDLLFDIDLNQFYRFHILGNNIITILTHPNNHPYDSATVITNEEGIVIDWLRKDEGKTWKKNQINAGIHLLSIEVLDCIDKKGFLDLDRDVLRGFVGNDRFLAYHTIEYIADLGTPERLKNAINDYQSKIPEKRNKNYKKCAVFLDRDGVINKEKGLIRDINKFELLEHVSEAIRIINESGYLAIVITNQPVIARGELTIEGLKEIHNKMETLIGQEMAYIDDIFFCPHHPHKGYDGEILEYKIECNCRKPKPGMIFAAAEKYNIDLAKSWIVGNSLTDIEAGINAGCNVSLINNTPHEHHSIMKTYNNLLQFCNENIKRYKMTPIQ